MSPCLEFKGKNINAAVKKACEELNISESVLKYDVISFGSSGIFGLVGAKKARIRVILPKAKIKPALEPRQIKNNFKSSDEEKQEEQIKEKSPDADNNTTGVTEQQKQPGTASAIDDSYQEAINFGKKALQQIIDLITTDAEITVTEQPGRILFNIKGGNSALLIGKRGQNLEAIQYLVSKIINKHYENRIHVHIDVEGYLESRQAILVDRSIKLAKKVKRTGKSVTLGIMNGHDRRIVHLALKEHKAVTTKSFGNDFFRKLVIFPKSDNSNNKKN